MPDGLLAIDAVLDERLGLDRASIGPEMVPRAVRSRMRATGAADVDAYAALVSSSPAELQALIDEVVVPESWFFRDERPFALLRERAAEGWASRPARPPLRILSLPCAGGEEPYSIAVVLEEAGLAPGRSRIDAVDVSERRLEFARRGVYSRNALRGVGPERVGRWFRERRDGLEFDPSARDRVRFRPGNVLDPALLAGEPAYDFVFCRNLLIYLRREARARAEANLDRLLAPDGVLVIGHADTLGASDVGRSFVPVGGRGSFSYSRRPPGEPPPPRHVEVALAAPPAVHLPPRLAAPPPLFALLAPPAPSPPRPPASAPEPAEDPRPLLEQAMDHANRGRHGQALACCEREIRRAGPSAAAFFLMGGIHQASGRRAEAEACFHKAIYLDPSHDEALLTLALIADRRGDGVAAAGFRRRAERALKNRAAKADNATKTGGPTHE